jgi:hypothetical protein
VLIKISFPFGLFGYSTVNIQQRGRNARNRRDHATMWADADAGIGIALGEWQKRNEFGNWR